MQLAAEEAMARGLEKLSDKVNPDYDFYSAVGSEDPQGAALALEVGSGGILAWVGGEDFKTDPFDHIIQHHIEPGAAFKPLIYASAVETGTDPGRSGLGRPGQLRPARPGRTVCAEQLQLSLRG